MTQAAAIPPHGAFTGADPSPPGQPQEQTPVDDPHAEVEIKSQLKPGGSVAKEENPKPSHQSCYTSSRLNPYDQLDRLFVYGIYKRTLNDNPISKTEKETQMYRTDFGTLWEKARVGCSERIALKQVYYQG